MSVEYTGIRHKELKRYNLRRRRRESCEWSLPPESKKRMRVERSKFRAKKDIFPFLSLPAELRIMIYKLLYARSEEIIVKINTRFPIGYLLAHTMPENMESILQRCWAVDSFWPLEELMFVNRQIYGEVVPILYGKRFEFDNVAKKTDFMEMIYPESRRLLKENATFSFIVPPKNKEQEEKQASLKGRKRYWFPKYSYYDGRVS